MDREKWRIIDKASKKTKKKPKNTRDLRYTDIHKTEDPELEEREKQNSFWRNNGWNLPKLDKRYLEEPGNSTHPK